MPSVDFAPKIGRLIRLLASPVDGEALGAARALDRTLRSAGHDIHWLADRIEAGLEPRVEYRTVIGTKAPAPAMLPPLLEEFPRSRRLDWLAVGIVSPALSEWQREFCGSLRAQVFSQPHKTISPKQRAAANEVFSTLWCKGVRA